MREIRLSLWGSRVREPLFFWLRGAEGDAEFSDNSDSLDNFACGSKLSDNLTKNPK